jgi:hypothetical protein
MTTWPPAADALLATLLDGKWPQHRRLEAAAREAIMPTGGLIGRYRSNALQPTPV